MAFISLDIPPGVLKTGSKTESGGRWRDCNLIRWHQNRLRPVGGWFSETAAMTGAPRKLFTWSTNAGFAQMFIGTNNRLYLWTGGSALTELSDSLTGGATLGPASMNEKTIVRLEELNIDLFRINLSHTDTKDLQE